MSNLQRDKKNINSIAVIGSYVPRQCGIATFTQDFCESIAKEMDQGQVIALAMDDVLESYDYPERVRLSIQANFPQDYANAADFLNFNVADVVSLQHEYGLYGGPAGANIVRMMRELQMPIVTTMHTVLPKPTEEVRKVTEGLADVSNRLVVMSDHAKETLIDSYSFSPEKIAVIPHGIPDFPFMDPNFYKDSFGVEGKNVILTFGLLSPDKGIEVMIKAMQKVVKEDPDTVYIVLGKTHPHVKRLRSEEYRLSLKHLVNKLGLKENVIFVDRFVSFKELCKYISAADIYVLPYKNAEQATSGTLSYALGAGKVVVSTPYRHATELLSDGRGEIFPFNDDKALAETINALFKNPRKMHAIRKNAYTYCRAMIWSEVARSYLSLFREVIDEQARYPKPVASIYKSKMAETELPEINLRHFYNITDDTGILQHAVFATPDRKHGYCTDDNARALIAAVMHYELRTDPSIIPKAQTYLAFLFAAFNEQKRRFHNFMSYDRKWLEDFGSEDSHARAIWALGVAVSSSLNSSFVGLSSRLFIDALPAVEDFEFPRSWAFAILGIYYYQKKFRGDLPIKRSWEVLANRLYNLFEKNASSDWVWCEDTITYANARLCQALILSGHELSNEKMLDMGLRSLDWLLDIQTGEEGQLSIIGNDGWKKRGEKETPHFDQQPLEAHAFVDACLAAYRVTRDVRFVKDALRCFEWFLGYNDIHVPVYDFSTGGCRDGLLPNSLNENQGAESTLAYLLSLLAMHSLPNEAFSCEKPAAPAKKSVKLSNAEKKEFSGNCC